MAYHPDGIHRIEFREDDHSYTDNNGMVYTSGTTFIKPFFPEFDAVTVSTECSKGSNPEYAGRDPKEIQAEWATEGKRGSTEGDNVHLYAETSIQLLPRPKPISERCGLIFIQADKAIDSLLTRYDFVAAEMIVFSPGLCIAGQIDLLMWDPETGEYLILDWKQNKEIKTRNLFKNQYGLPPIDHLEGSDISKYSLQLSLYNHILIKENYFPKAKGYRRALIHLTPDAAIPYRLENYSYEIEGLLKHAKRI